MISRSAKTAAAIAITLPILCTGCDRQHIVRSVDGHTFVVPKADAIQSNIPWLPASQADGLMFILNPSEPPPKQIVVLLQENGQVCGGAGRSTYLGSMCGNPADNRRFDGADYQSKLRKVPPQGNDIESFYVESESPNTYVASCVSSPTKSPELGDLCSCIGQYKNLRYTIGFREKIVGQLPDLTKKANMLLQSWER
jgi:hypothetical protein